MLDRWKGHTKSGGKRNLNCTWIWVRTEGLNTRFKVANGLGYLCITGNVWSRERARCPVALVESGVGRIRVVHADGRAKVEIAFPRPACMHVLHLPGALKIDPPGSTRCWCCLSPKWSARDTKRSALPLKQVSALLNKSGWACAGSRPMRRVSCAT